MKNKSEKIISKNLNNAVDLNTVYSDTETTNVGVPVDFDSSISIEKYFESHFSYIKEQISNVKNSVDYLTKENIRLSEKVSGLTSDLNTAKQQLEKTHDIKWHWIIISGLIASIGFLYKYVFFDMSNKINNIDKNMTTIGEIINSKNTSNENKVVHHTEIINLNK